MMFSLMHKMRKTYAKVMQIWDESEKEMREWGQKDPEEYAIYIHYCHICRGGDMSGFTAY